MKLTKRILAAALAVLMLTAFMVPAFAADTNSNGTLKFNEDGKFKILIFADSQDDETIEETTAALMREALDAQKPDLVVYLGDNTVAQGYENQAKAIEAVTAPCVERNIPFTVVFGNHDEEQGVEKEVLLKEYQKYPGCLATDMEPELYGCGNHFLPITSSDSDKIAFNLWFIDSGTTVAELGGYDYVREDQINWYKENAAMLKAQNGGETVPALSFQHIIVTEVYDALGMIKIPLGIKNFTYDNQPYLPIPNFSSHEGYVFEPPCPSYINGGQMDAWLETGDVIGTFFGHDHINSFTTNYEGIDITTVPTVGCHSYSYEINRGVGVITLDEKDLSTYKYEALRMYDFALAEGSSILECDGAKTKFEYTLNKFFDILLTKIHELLSFNWLVK